MLGVPIGEREGGIKSPYKGREYGIVRERKGGFG